MSESTPNPTLPPEEAAALIREHLPLPLAPETGSALAARRSQGRQYCPPAHLVDVPGRPGQRYQWDEREVRQWCLEHHTDLVQTALALYQLVEFASGMGFHVKLLDIAGPRILISHDDEASAVNVSCETWVEAARDARDALADYMNEIQEIDDIEADVESELDQLEGEGSHV